MSAPDILPPEPAVEALAEAWYEHGRALFGLGALEGAERSLREAVVRRPRYPEALQELAHVIWLRTGDAEMAAAVFDGESDLRYQKSLVYTAAGQHQKALESVQAALHGNEAFAGLAPIAAQLALTAGQPDLAVAYAVDALNRDPSDSRGAEVWIAARLAQGANREALEAARRMVELDQTNQTALALLATAARLTGAPEYRALCDYQTLVRSAVIATPPGWPTLEAYLADLGRSLEALHTSRHHPFGQSLRSGTQTPTDLTNSTDPVIQAFFEAAYPLIAEYIAAVVAKGEVLAQRNTGGYRLSGAWSVSLRPGGFHIDHIHPQGWISSAFYVAVPEEATGRDWREGWIKFGEPHWATSPKLEAEHFVKPEPGLLVLFPSYMWHGTVPFTTEERRLTIAFDAVPA